MQGLRRPARSHALISSRRSGCQQANGAELTFTEAQNKVNTHRAAVKAQPYTVSQWPSLIFSHAKEEEEGHGDRQVQQALDEDVWEWASTHQPGPASSPQPHAAPDRVALWISRTHELLHGNCRPKIAYLAVDALARIPPDAAAAHVATLHPLVHELVARNILHGGQWRPRLLDALSDALEAHAALRAAADADRSFCTDVERLIDAAVANPGTYNDPYAFANLAAAQRKLRITAPAFWEGVLSHSLEGVEPRGVSTALHTLSTLYAVQDFTELPRAVAARLLALAREQARSMPGKDLTISLEALAKMRVELDGPTMSKFREAMRESMPYLAPRQVASAVRAAANLGLHFHGLFARAVNFGVRRTATAMNQQDLANTLYGLAKWTHKHEAELVDVLAKAVARRLRAMRAVEVHDCLVSLSRIGGSGKLSARECAAAAHFAGPGLSPHMQLQLRRACRVLGAEIERDDWMPEAEGVEGRWEGGLWHLASVGQQMDGQEEAEAGAGR